AALQTPLLDSGHAFVQPGKEASMSLYPLGDCTIDDLLRVADALVPQVAPEVGVAGNVNGVEVRPLGIDKGTGAARIANLLGIPLATMAGVAGAAHARTPLVARAGAADSAPDFSYLSRVGCSAPPANATPAVRQSVDYVARESFGAG